MAKSFKIVGMTDITIRNILQNAGGEALGLYCAYFEVAVWQNTYRVKATSGFMAKRLGWGRDKLIKHKKSLVDIGVIEDYQDRGEDGKVKGHYVIIKHLVDEDYTPETSHAGNITGGVSTTQVLTTGSLSTLNNNKDSAGESKDSLATVSKKEKEISSAEFVWRDYLNNLLQSKRPELRMIAYFMGRKKMVMASKAEVNAVIKRYIRVAKDVAVFTPEKIKKAYDDIEGEDGLSDKYTLETVYKYLTK